MQLLTITETARRLRLAPYTVARLAREGRLPGALKLPGSRTWRVDWSQLEAALERSAKEVA